MKIWFSFSLLHRLQLKVQYEPLSPNAHKTIAFSTNAFDICWCCHLLKRWLCLFLSAAALPLSSTFICCCSQTIRAENEQHFPIIFLSNRCLLILSCADETTQTADEKNAQTCLIHNMEICAFIIRRLRLSVGWDSVKSTVVAKC